MGSTASFIIISSLLGLLLAGLIFLVMWLNHPSGKKPNSGQRRSTSSSSQPTRRLSPPQVKQLSSDSANVWGAIYVNGEEFRFRYPKGNYGLIQRETETIQNSLSVMIKTPYKDIRKTRLDAITRALQGIAKNSSLSSKDFSAIKQEIIRYENSL